MSALLQTTLPSKKVPILGTSSLLDLAREPPGVLPAFFFFFLSGMKFYPHLKDTGSSDDDCICRSSEVDSGPAEADISSSWTWAHSHGTNLSNTQQAAAAWATLGV